jgi:hypothetical protein
LARGFLNVNLAIIRFLAAPVVKTVNQSISVLRRYVDVLKQVGEQLAEAAKGFITNMTKNFVEFDLKSKDWFET